MPTKILRGNSLGPLQDGGTVAVIGGGPGGVAAAIAIKQGARALGRNVRVTIVEGKQFAGEQHHNQCAGVLSPPIAELMQGELGVAFPHHLTRVAINEYVLHTARQEIALKGHNETSMAMRRVHFDEYMLAAARERGVEEVRARATDVEFHADCVIVNTESGPLQVDLVVGAFGLDEGSADLFARTVGYRPPPALNTVVTKYHPGDAAMAEFGSCIHAFLPGALRIEFGGITPKGNHLTINIAGVRLDTSLMRAFMQLPEVRQVLPHLDNAGRFDSRDLRFFKGRFPCGLARNFAGDRFVMVGDAAGLVRAFKGKGITSAIQTGVRAAQVILCAGISAEALQAYQAANADIVSDLPYGQAMRFITVAASRLGLMDTVIRAAKAEPRLQQALFDAVSAHQTYRHVLRDVLTPASIRAVLTNLGRRDGLATAA